MVGKVLTRSLFVELFVHKHKCCLILKLSSGTIKLRGKKKTLYLNMATMLAHRMCKHTVVVD